MQPGLQEALGQPVIVDNRPGGGGTIGASEVLRSASDGYTLLMSNTAPISLSPFMMERQPYDPVQGFTHIAFVGAVPNVFILHPSVPAKTLTELVAWIKAQRDPINYGSGGVGSIGHIIGESFKRQQGLVMEHVPYRGSAPMLSDLLGGRLQFAVDTLTQNVQAIKEGKLIGVAVTSRERMPIAPELPTVAEAGFPDLLAENFIGVSGPAGLPAVVVDRLHAAVTQTLHSAALRERLEGLGIASRPMSSAEFTRFVTDQVTAWGPAVKASGARLN